MIVSRKDESRLYRIWKNSEGSWSRLSGPCWSGCYFVNQNDHRLYHILGSNFFGVNNKSFELFKGST